MHAHTGRLLSALVLGSFLALGQGGVSHAAEPTAQPTVQALQTIPANGTLSVSPPLISLSIAPGSTNSAELQLHSGVAETIHIEADGLAQGKDGAFNSLPAADDKSQFSARSLMAVAPDSFQMDAGEDKTVKVTVAMPKDAGAGTRYAILKITGTPVSSDNVGIGVELGVSTLITLAKTNQTHTGSIKDLTVGKVGAGQPLTVTGMLFNTGNSHFGAAPNQVNTSATLWNSNGDIMATSQGPMSGNSIVPTFGRQFQLLLKTAQALKDGHYHVKVDALLQDGTPIDSAAVDFDIASGEVLGATAAPATVPSSPSSDSGGLLLVAGLFMGAVLGLLLAGFFALKNRRSQRGKAAR